MNAKRFDNIMLQTKTVGAKATPAGIEVTFESAEPAGTAPAPQTYDLVLQAVGRTPNGKKISADKAGVAVTDRGFINVDIQMRTNVPHVFGIGDIVGQPMLAHKAVHEAHVAAEVIAGELQGNKELASAAFNPRVIPASPIPGGTWPRQDPGRRHGRHPCRRHDWRDAIGDRDGRRRGGYRQDDSSAPHAGRKHRHGG